MERSIATQRVPFIAGNTPVAAVQAASAKARTRANILLMIGPGGQSDKSGLTLAAHGHGSRLRNERRFRRPERRQLGAPRHYLLLLQPQVPREVPRRSAKISRAPAETGGPERRRLDLPDGSPGAPGP